MAELKYQRLTRLRARSQFAVIYQSRSGLWLGDDHVLLVEATGYTENYKRFYFRDIQAITVQATERGRIWNIILGGILLLIVLVIIFTIPKTTPANWTGEQVAGEITLGGFAAIFAVAFLANFLAGPTCKTHLRTAVQTEELPSLSRVRQTGKVIGKIRPLIVAAQGELSGAEVVVRLQETIRASGPAAASRPNPPDDVPPVIH
jgi:uncharacterized integral membrane protein